VYSGFRPTQGQLIADGMAAQVESSACEQENAVDADTLQAEQERMRYENAHRHCRTCRTFEQPAHEPLFEKIDCAELARRWGVRETWVRNHVRRGCKDMIPHRKLGSNVVFEWGSEALNGNLYRCRIEDVLEKKGIAWHGWHAFRGGLATKSVRVGCSR